MKIAHKGIIDMKFVYVLTSSLDDFYYEQFFLSATSLRLHNPKAHVVVLIDSKTKQNLVGKRSAYEQMVSEVKIISPPSELSQKEASRWLKTSIHHYVDGDFIFIDCDTVIAKSLDPNFHAIVQVGAVLDTHVTLEQHHSFSYFQKEDEKAGFSSSMKTNARYNGGLVYCKDDTLGREFFERWHSLWIEGRKKGCSQDMPSLNQANCDMGEIVAELGGEWNCQISHNGLPYLHEAAIIHYFSTSLVSFSPAFILASSEILSRIRTLGAIPSEVYGLLKIPQTAFVNRSRIVSDETTLDIIDSAYFSKLLSLRRRHKKLFFMIDKYILRKNV